MKTIEIKNLYDNLSSLQHKDGLTYSAKVTYAIMRNMRQLATIVEDYETSMQGIYSKYGTPLQDQPGYVFIPEDQREDATNEIQELNNAENDIKFMMISIDDLRDLQLTIADMEALYPMIKEEEG